MRLDDSTNNSAVVRLWLSTNDRMIPLSHTGDTFIIAKAPTDLPACDAHIVFTVDSERMSGR